MIGFNSFLLLSFFILFLIHIDYLYYFCTSKLWYLNLQTNERLLLKKKTKITEEQTNFFWLYFIIFLLWITKFSLCNYFNLFVYFNMLILCFITMFILFAVKTFKKKLSELKFLSLILQIFFYIFLSLAFIDNFLSLFFLFELLAVCYYFFFLSSFTPNKFNNVNQFKNLLILYLWNSFWTSIFFSIFLISLIYEFNTIIFSEVSLLWTSELNYIAYLFFLSISLKLGLPLFHFFKIQIYYILNIHLMFFYSIITTYINLSLFLIICNFEIFYNFIENTSVLSLFILGGLLILINAFQTWTIYNLFLYSAITTFFVFISLIF